MVTQLATQFKKKKKKKRKRLAIAMANHGCNWLQEFKRHIIYVFIQYVHARINCLYLCGCIGLSECEAHFNMIIVPASVCGGVRRRWRALLVSQSGRVFIVRSERWSSQRGGTVNGDNPSVSESVGSVQSRCRPESRV